MNSEQQQQHDYRMSVIESAGWMDEYQEELEDRQADELMLGDDFKAIVSHEFDAAWTIYTRIRVEDSRMVGGVF